MRIKVALLILSLSVLTGCAGNGTARKLATTVNQTTLTYEKELDAKITAERTFYRNQRALILQKAEGDTTLEHFQPRAEDTDPPGEFEKTLLYGRMRVNMERDARVAADTMIYSSHPNFMGQIIQFIDEGIAEDIAYYNEVRDRQAQLKIDLLKNLEELESNRKQLEAVRKNLTKLEKKPSLTDELSELFDFGKVVQATLQAKETEPASDGKEADGEGVAEPDSAGNG